MITSAFECPLATHASHALFRCARPGGAIGPGCLFVVDALWSAPNRTLTRPELLACLHVSRASLWRHVSRLEAVGLVERLDRHTVYLVEDWAARADALAPLAT